MNEVRPDIKRPKHAQSPENPTGKSSSVFPREEKAKQPSFSTITLLIVDDESDLRSAIVFDFKRKGFSVLSAENGTKAFELIQTNRIDLVISDVRMPSGDGLFLLEKIQSLPVKIPLIFITGFSDVTEVECISRGAIKVFSKPFDRKLLMKSVLNVLALETK